MQPAVPLWKVIAGPAGKTATGPARARFFLFSDQSWTKFSAQRDERKDPLRRLVGRLLRRDDLIGRASGEFGHVVEFRRERANAGSRRANLDDEIADLGFRDHRLHRVPA